MPLAPRLNQFVNDQGIICQLIHHAKAEDYAAAIKLADIKPDCAAKVVPLIDVKGPAVAVIPFEAELDLDIINDTLSRSFQVLSDANASKLFKDCESGAFPIFGMAYGLPVIADVKLFDIEAVISSSGCSSALVKIPQRAFGQVMRGAIRANLAKFSAQDKDLGIGEGESSVQEEQHYSQLSSAPSLGLNLAAEKLNKLYKLPPMPDTAVKILHLTADDDATIQDLSILIERDPSLTAQVMRYARSALFNYRGELTCVNEAVNKVLGFDRVSQLAMGLAAAKAFNIPSEGAFGLQSFWRHSLYCAVLTQALAVMADPDLEFDAREAYLAGMLHNFGLLLIGHLFPPEFRMLNKLREAEPDAPMRTLEEQVFGMGGAQEFITMGHGTIGAILLKLWDLPESTVKAAGMHQNKTYTGEHQNYVRLVQLANVLLSEHGIGDEPLPSDLAAPLMESLGLKPEMVETLVMTLVEQCASLDGMVSSMAA